MSLGAASQSHPDDCTSIYNLVPHYPLRLKEMYDTISILSAIYLTA